MSDIVPIIQPPENASGDNLGGLIGTANKPWTAVFAETVFVNGVAVAPAESPTLTGTVAVPTPGGSDDSTKPATTAWVRDYVESNPTSSGDVDGPASATDGAPALFDGTTGKLLKNSTPTGTGNPVLATSPTLVTPNLGTPSAGTLTNCTGLPVATGVSGLGTGVATFLATPTSANLRSALTDETGTGAAVFATSPTLVTPALGTPSSGTLTNCTGLPTSGVVDFNASVDARITTALGSAYLKADGSVAGTGRQELARLNFTDWTTLTISGGTVTSTQTLHTITSESGSADDLDTINPTEVGDLLVIRADVGHTITIRNGAGNITCAGAANFAITGGKLAVLVRHASGWLAGALGGAAATLADGDYGDITVGSSGTTLTVDNDAITYAKIQNVSATSRIIGRKTSGAGDMEECTLSEVLDFVGSAANGDILYRTGGSWARLAVGSSGQVLQSSGTAPAWGFAYREVWIGAGSIIPRTTNGPSSSTVELATNDVMVDYLDFDASTEEGATFCVSLPNRWDQGTLKVKVYWTAASGSGGVAWGIRARANGDDDPMDSAYGTEVVVTDTLLATNDVHITAASSALTVGNTPATDDLVFFEITREVANGSNTLGVDARLIGVKIQYLEGAASAAW